MQSMHLVRFWAAKAPGTELTVDGPLGLGMRGEKWRVLKALTYPEISPSGSR
jgi:hypothetical protein